VLDGISNPADKRLVVYSYYILPIGSEAHLLDEEDVAHTAFTTNAAAGGDVPNTFRYQTRGNSRRPRRSISEQS